MTGNSPTRSNPHGLVAGAHLRARYLPLFAATLFLAGFLANPVRSENTLPGTTRLQLTEPLDELMVRGIRKHLLQELAESPAVREKLWKERFADSKHYQANLDMSRVRLSTLLGAVDKRITKSNTNNPTFELNATWLRSSLLASTDIFEVRAIKWPVQGDFYGEGLLLVPGKVEALAVAIPDADWTPEMFCGLTTELPTQLQLARNLALQGCMVVVPTLISRDSTYSGNPAIAMTNQPHREFLYRQSFQSGRHPIGYEVQKIMAAVDLLEKLSSSTADTEAQPIGLAGVGEGALLALYSAALDTRIDSTLVSGYFECREQIWMEPIYRNVWSLLTEFGDAEIASMISPRRLTIEASKAVEVVRASPPVAGQNQTAAPGRIFTPKVENVMGEYKRALNYFETLGHPKQIQLCVYADDDDAELAGGHEALQSFLKGLGIEFDSTLVARSSQKGLAVENRGDFEKDSQWAQQRQARQLRELQDYAQSLMMRSFHARDRTWQVDRSSLKAWQDGAAKWRETVHEEVIGKINEPLLPFNPQTSKVLETDNYTGYQVLLDVIPDVVAGGVLLLPNDLKDGERRPVVVCQHGLEGTAEDTISREPNAFRFYKAFADELCKRGFIVYAPQNPYRGKDRFRVIQRMANPLKLSLFSFIIAQHEQTVRWLGSLPQVDKDRIAFYGLSYGGKTAMRVPPFVSGYCLSICSGDFTDWIRVITTNKDRYGYCFTSEYEIPEWNIGYVANYAELAMLISPRPFMVEQGHLDGGTPSEWVSGEFGRVQRHYDLLGIGDRAVLEFFNGPHTINGKGTFEFLHKHLQWPTPDK